MVLGALALLALGTACTSEHHAAAKVATVAAQAAPKRCTVPAPTSAKGYAAMFARIPVAQWGGADVSISVPLADGRSVWLYGDTFSTGRFVHSTAITQDRGCLHVSHGGAQLLPNSDAHHIYWIMSAQARSGGRLYIQARATTLTGTGVWDFRDGGHTRTALAFVAANGDVTFSRWVSDVRSPAPNPGPMYVYGPHHFGYARHAHPEARLASGRTLYTTCQNWDNGLHSFADYRPIFTER